MSNDNGERECGIQSGLDADAEEYVESIMSTQRKTRVETPKVSGRKRNRSVPDSSEHNSPDPVEQSRDRHGKSRRTLYGNNGGSNLRCATHIPSDQEEHDDPILSVKHLITKLSADMHMLYASLSERIDKLESGLEDRISAKVAQVLDKRVNRELERIKKGVEVQLDTFKDTIRVEIGDEIDDINEKLSRMPTPSSTPDISLNVVIRNLPQNVGENTKDKVDSLISRSMQLSNVRVVKAERKTVDNSNKPGIVIASFKSADDKKKVMSAKSKLRNSKQHSNVYIHHDQSRDERRMASNLRTIIDELNNGGSRLSFNGSRVSRGDNAQRARRRDNGDGPLNHERQRHGGSPSRQSNHRSQSSHQSNLRNNYGGSERDSNNSYKRDGRRNNGRQNQRSWN